MKTRIIVDSTADITPEDQRRVRVVPLTVHFGDEEYIDGVTIDHKTFYKKLAEADELPTTSQPTLGAFQTEFEAMKTAGEGGVVITLSHRLSGTYQSAKIAAEAYENLFVIESGSAGVGSGILVERALELVDEGLEARQIAQQLEEEKKKIVIIALVDTLRYLKKGGRISKTAAIAGTVLNIKPVMLVTDGVVRAIGKARGLRQGNHLLTQSIEEFRGVDARRPVLLGYTGLSDVPLLKYIEDSRPFWEGCVERLRYTTMGSVIGTHVGPGAVAVGFFTK